MGKHLFTHSCNFDSSPSKSKTTNRKKQVSKNERQAINEIYNKYYKNQLSALYRAVQE